MDAKRTIAVNNPARDWRCAVCLAWVFRDETHEHTADAWRAADEAVLANDHR